MRVLPDFRTTNGWVPEPVLMGTMLGEDVPTRPSCAEGGYEVQSSPFAPGAGEQLAEEAARRLRELKDATD